MAVVIDEAWLAEHGVKAEGQEAEMLVDMVMDELELRVGMAIADKLSDKQIAEFENIDDEDQRMEWLDKVLPGYQAIIEQKTADISADITKSNSKKTLIKSWAQA